MGWRTGLALVALITATAACRGTDPDSAGRVERLATTDSTATPTSEGGDDLSAAIGRVGALSQFEVLESGKWEPPLASHGEPDLRWRFARLAVAECEVLDFKTQLSGLDAVYPPPGIRQTYYQQNTAHASLLVGDRLVIVNLHRLCSDGNDLSLTSDQLMTLAESLIAAYEVEP